MRLSKRRDMEKIKKKPSINLRYTVNNKIERAFFACILALITTGCAGMMNLDLNAGFTTKQIQQKNYEHQDGNAYINSCKAIHFEQM